MTEGLLFKKEAKRLKGCGGHIGDSRAKLGAQAPAPAAITQSRVALPIDSRQVPSLLQHNSCRMTVHND
jgi:hypothetical protein